LTAKVLAPAEAGKGGPVVTGLTASSATPLRFPELRSRLTLTPLSAREVLVNWTVRPEDRQIALEWLGADGVHSVLAIRLSDVTDLNFNGSNAHSTWDVELSFGDQHRTIGLGFDGRSLASCLGLRAPSGYFHTIVHARLCHLPRVGLAPSLPARWLRVMTNHV
jgi:hypothetical protein